MKLSFFVACILAFSIISISSSRAESTDNVCKYKVDLGTWETGFSDKKTVNDIANQFSPEHRKSVKIIDKISPYTTESEINKLLGVSPVKAVRMFSQSPRIEWHLIGKNSAIVMAIQYHKGCIGNISMSEKPFQVYSKRNKINWNIVKK